MMITIGFILLIAATSLLGKVCDELEGIEDWIKEFEITEEEI